MKNKDKPGLVLVHGGKAAGGVSRRDPVRQAAIKPGRSGVGAGGLTAKQAAYAEAVAGGATLVEAYRGAYDTSRMAARTVENEASKLRAHHGVTTMIDDLLARKAAKAHAVGVRAEERIWRGVWALAEGKDTPPAVRSSALALAAKMAGMLTEKVEITAPQSAEAIEQELMQRLARYK